MNLPEPMLPGQEIVTEGLADLTQGRLTESALVLLIAAPRLRQLGLRIPHLKLSEPYEHVLYARLEERLGPGAHSHYNSLLRAHRQLRASHGAPVEPLKSENALGWNTGRTADGESSTIWTGCPI